MMKRPLYPHDFQILRELVPQAAEADKFTKYVYGLLIAWDYAQWDEKSCLVTITAAGRKALADQDMRLARAKAKQTAQAAIWDAEFAAEYVAELEGLASKAPAAHEHLESAQLAAEQAKHYAMAAQEALERDDFTAVQNASHASSRACHAARQSLNEAASLVMKGDA